MSAMFHVGQRVVAVGTGKKRPANAKTKKLVRGGVYTIREIDDRAAPFHGGQLTLRFEEVVNSTEDTIFGVWERGYTHLAFRPVKTTNIDVFLRMLEPVDA